jgi:hypothetical protein
MSPMTNTDLQRQAVNRLLRCRQTKRYFTGNGWSEDPSHAKPFRDEIDAVRTCVSNDLNNIELVIRLSGSSADLFSTPIR